MDLEVAAVQQPDLREEDSGHEGHLGELLQTALHFELVSLLLHHERHDPATSARHAARELDHRRALSGLRATLYHSHCTALHINDRIEGYVHS